MYLKHYETSKFTIEILLDNRSELISFDRCFECNIPEILPKVFRNRDNRVFTKVKLNKFENVVSRISCKGKVEFSDLKALLPTVFDFKKIKKLNEIVFIEQNREQLIELSKEIIGKEQVEKLLDSKKQVK